MHVLRGIIDLRFLSLALTTEAKLQINTNNLSGTFPKEICDLQSVDVYLDCHTGLVCEDDCCPQSWCSWH